MTRICMTILIIIYLKYILKTQKINEKVDKLSSESDDINLDSYKEIQEFSNKKHTKINTFKNRIIK